MGNKMTRRYNDRLLRERKLLLSLLPLGCGMANDDVDILAHGRLLCKTGGRNLNFQLRASKDSPLGPPAGAVRLAVVTRRFASARSSAFEPRSTSNCDENANLEREAYV